MAILHTVNKSPFEKNSLETCLNYARDGSSVLLIEDGVYAATKGTRVSSSVQDAMKSIKIYALGPDLDARGIKDKILEGVTLVDYAGFVDLAADHDSVQSWL
jgi:tRNA 2-thiouridine synthesizing protein B